MEKRPNVRCLIALACLCGGVTPASGQTSLPDGADRTKTLTSVFGGFDPWKDPTLTPYAPQTPGDSDLGDQVVLTPQRLYEPFTLRLDQQGLWTSNAALTDGDEIDDFYSTSSIGLSYVPKIAANTYGEISADYGFFRYASHSELDFDSLEASIGAIHVFREAGDLSVWLRYNHERLLEGRGHDEIFTDHSIETGLYFPVPLGPRHLLFGSYASEFSLDGNPGYARRDEHGITLGYRFTPTDRVELTGYYRFFALDYNESSRLDLLQSAGLSLTTRLTQGIDLILTGSYSLNDSNVDGGDYEVGDAGGILSIRVAF